MCLMRWDGTPEDEQFARDVYESWREAGVGEDLDDPALLPDPEWFAEIEIVPEEPEWFRRAFDEYLSILAAEDYAGVVGG